MARILPALTAAASLWLAACGEPTPPGAPAEPISGAALDSVQQDVREILARDFEERVADEVRVERADDGRRAVVHAALRRGLGPGDYERICQALSEAAASVLTEGQSLEVHLLHSGSVVHSCGL